MAANRARVLQVSDIHFGPGHRSSLAGGSKSTDAHAIPLVERILRDATEPPDIVVVSGDLTSRGFEEEFEQALVFIRRLQSEFELSADNFVIVPGNHDVTWQEGTDSTGSGQYRAFASEFYGKPTDQVQMPSARFGGVYVLGLDSNRLMQKSSGGLGLVGERQLDEAAKRVADEATGTVARILALHHHLLPVGWIEPKPENGSASVTLDAASILAWAQEHRFQVILHGHQHQSVINSIHRAELPGGPVVVAAAPSLGAAGHHLPHQGRNGYQWITIEGTRLRIDVREFDERLRAVERSTIDFVYTDSGAFAATALPPISPDRSLQPRDVRRIAAHAMQGVLDTVAHSYGPTGGLRATGPSEATRHVRDGASILSSIQSSDPAHQRFIDDLTQSIQSIEHSVGDGRKTTAIVAAQATLSGLKSIDLGQSDHDIALGLKNAARVAAESIDEITKPATMNTDELKSVLRSACAGDDSIAESLSRAAKLLQHPGGITIETRVEQSSPRIDTAQDPPFAFDLGSVPTWLQDEAGEVEITLESPLVIASDASLNSMDAAMPLLESIAKAGRTALLVFSKYSAEILSMIQINRARGTLDIVPIAFGPAFGVGEAEDLAIAAGARFIHSDGGVLRFDIDRAGECDSINISNRKLTLTPIEATAESRGARVAHLLAASDGAHVSPRTRNRLLRRARRLDGRSVTLTITDISSRAARLRRSIAEDGAASLSAYFSSGSVPGGGAALSYAAERVRQMQSADPGLHAGCKAFADALEEPIRTLINATDSDAEAVLKETRAGTHGFDAVAGVAVPNDAGGPITPAAVTRAAILAAGDASARMVRTRSLET